MPHPHGGEEIRPSRPWWEDPRLGAGIPPLGLFNFLRGQRGLGERLRPSEPGGEFYLREGQGQGGTPLGLSPTELMPGRLGQFIPEGSRFAGLEATPEGGFSLSTTVPTAEDAPKTGPPGYGIEQVNGYDVQVFRDDAGKIIEMSVIGPSLTAG